jgi:hypothetical protein
MGRPSLFGGLRRNNASGRPLSLMIAITISVEAFEAIEAQPLGQSMVAPPLGADGMIRVWLDGKFVDRLGQLRDPGESYSDVILRMAKATR